MVNPAGLDQFFEDVTAQNKGLSQPDFARVEQLMKSYGMELLGLLCQAMSRFSHRFQICGLST